MTRVRELVTADPPDDERRRAAEATAGRFHLSLATIGLWPLVVILAGAVVYHSFRTSVFLGMVTAAAVAGVITLIWHASAPMRPT